MSTGWEEFAVIQTESAYAEHQEQKIVMNEEGRKRLLQALTNKETKVKAYCHDGEGYDLLLQYGEEPVAPFYLMYTLLQAEREVREEATGDAPDLLVALEEIAKRALSLSFGSGPFSRDPLTHCSNTVAAMKALALAAIAKAKEEKCQ